MYSNVDFSHKDASHVNRSNLSWKRQFSTKEWEHQEMETFQNLSVSSHEHMKA